MAKVSVIVPSRNEGFLQATVDDLLAKASGEVEILPILDGYEPNPPLTEHPQVRPIRTKPLGLRNSVNVGAAAATGAYLMKVDAHCMFDPGYDETLQRDCDADWLVVPRRMSLDPFTWAIAVTGRAPVDYEFIAYPYDTINEAVRMGNVWKDRARRRREVLLDEDMSFQGSCWFCHTDYFRRLGPLEEQGWGTFVLEPEELGNKVWLSGGKVMVNKRLWYAHWHKGKQHGRGYFINRRELIRGRQHHVKFFMANGWLPRWPAQVHPYPWLIEHFWPVPTWPENALSQFNAEGAWIGPTTPRGEYVL